MPQYLLLAGNTPSLTLAEAKLMLGPTVAVAHPQVISFTAASDELAKQNFLELGSAVKLAKVVVAANHYQANELSTKLVELLQADGQTKLRFSVAQWGDQQTARLLLTELKNHLAGQQIKARFLEGPREGLSAAVLLHQPVTELIVFQVLDFITLAKTIAVQDIDQWTVKDRQKPYANRQKGMLPPKIARTMVNLALGLSVSPETLVYDPFCGTGTVLMEALQRGARVVGSDDDPQAAGGAQKNLTWFADRFHLSTSFQVFQSDVTHVQLNQLPARVDVIITEPFLGRPRPKVSQLPGMFRGLNKLYQGAFHHWQSLLKPGGQVVIIFPRVEVPGGRTFDLSNFVDKLKSQGYTPQVELGTWRYHRPQAIVQRDIMILTYQG